MQIPSLHNIPHTFPAAGYSILTSLIWQLKILLLDIFPNSNY
jgi:hypothetical protein